MTDTDKTWFPNIWLDEVPPACRAHPNDWIIDFNGNPALFGPDNIYPNGYDQDALPRMLQPDEVVEFTQIIEGPCVTAELKNGKANVDNVPPGWETYRIDFDNDCIANDKNELVRILETDFNFVMQNGEWHPLTVTVECYRVSTTQWKFNAAEKCFELLDPA